MHSVFVAKLMIDDGKMNSFLSKRNSYKVLHWSFMSTCDFGHRLYVVKSQYWKQSPYFKSQALKYHYDEKLKIFMVSEGTSHRFKKKNAKEYWFFLICGFSWSFDGSINFVVYFYLRKFSAMHNQSLLFFPILMSCCVHPRITKEDKK